MKRAVLIVLLLTLAVPCLAFGQAQTAPPPKPGPEVQPLGYWVGTWKYEATKSSSIFTCEWFTGGFTLMCRGEGTNASGKFSNLQLMTYDSGAKAYTIHMASSTEAGLFVAAGSLAGSTWTWDWTGTFDGKPAKYHRTIVQVSPTSATSKIERSVDGGPWTVTGEATYTKVK